MRKTSKANWLSFCKNFFALILLFTLLNQNLKAQPNILYFMDQVHQSNQLNPAVQNCCNGFFSLPGLSGSYIKLLNSGFDYNDLIHPGTGKLADSLIIDIDNVKSRLGKKNYLSAEVSVPLLGFGFWSGRSNFSFEVSFKNRTNLAYPENIVALTGGNGDFIGLNNSAKIDRFGPDTYTYYEIASGWSRKMTHRLTLGAKFKILSGLAAIQKKRSNINLVTADTTYAMSIKTDFNYNISAPVKFSYDKDGLISEVNYEGSGSDFVPNRNLGLAIDFGAIYQMTDNLKLYGSITDLGFIRWGKYSTNIFQKGEFDYSGLTLDSVWTNSDYNEFEAWKDSLQEFIHFDHADSKFTTSLNSNIYIGASYDVTSFLNFGILSKTTLFDKSLHQAVTLSANLKPVKSFSASLSYSMMNREYKNIGFGMAYRLGIFQMFLITDNIYTAFIPKNSKVANFMFGLNLVFGCNKRDNFSTLDNHYPTKNSDFM